MLASEASSPGQRRRSIPYETSVSGWRLLWQRLNPFARREPVPTLGQIMMRVAIINDAKHIQAARSLADFYMRLELGGYGMLEFSALGPIAEAGYQSARALVAAWRDDERFQELQKLG